MASRIKLPPKKKSAKKGRNGIKSVANAREANGKPKAPRKKNGPIKRVAGSRIV